VPEAYEKRREVLMREIYRTARLEFQKPTGVTTSGVARAYEFEQTNRRLGEIAQSFARGEEELLALAARMLGADASGLTVTAPADFSVEDMTSDIANITGLIAMGVPPTAETEMKRRIVRRVLPNLPSAVEDAIESEFDELQKQDEQDAALEREVERAASHAAIEGASASEPDEDTPPIAA
jgi:hypothetical protein